MAEDEFGRVPPHSIEAEKGVLGSVLLDPDAFITVSEQLEPFDFYNRAHQVLFRAMQTLNEREETIDVVTLQNQLEREDQLDNVGGPDYLFDLAENTPTAANVGYYARIVAENAVLRRMIAAASDITKNAYESDEDIDSLLDSAEQRIMDVAKRRDQRGFQRLGEVVRQSLDHIDALAKNHSKVTGLSSGYPDLDEMTAGLHPDELMIVAARPGVGKTAFALNVAQNVATKQPGATVALFSLEMSAEQLVNRMLCAEGSIDATRLRTGQLNDEEWNGLDFAAEALSQAEIYIDDTPGIRMSEIRGKCRRLKQETKRLDLVVIDYLQLIESPRRNENRQQEVSEISRQLKKLAKELEVPVIALSQLSRSVEQRQNKRPVLSDLRESGSIEQDADIVAFLYREDYYDRDEDKEDSADADNIIEVIIEKNRSGARGTVQLIFTKEFNKFSSISFRKEEE